MSLSGAHKAAFRREATQEGRVFSIRDGNGFPAPADGAGRRAVPFWSKPTRAQRIVKAVEAFSGFEIVQIPVDVWLSDWLIHLERDRLLVGVNWAGGRATGFDMPPGEVLRWFAELEEPIDAFTRS
jgi:Protein of unknown function (DUF2750)